MKIFFDTEFTGLHQNTTLISIGLVTEFGHSFYAELNDYDRDQVDWWLERNLIANLEMEKTGAKRITSLPKNLPIEVVEKAETVRLISYDKWEITRYLARWLSRWNNIEIWGDCLAWDWVIFCEIFGGARDIPKNVSYIPKANASL